MLNWDNPYTRFGLLSLGVILLAGIGALAAGLPWWLIALVTVLAINVVTLVVYRYDKAIAGSRRTRVPEVVLLALALFGGSPSAFIAIYRFGERHKARKAPFIVYFWAIVAVQLAVLCGLLFWLGRI